MRCPKGMKEADTMLKVRNCKNPQAGYFESDFLDCSHLPLATLACMNINRYIWDFSLIQVKTKCCDSIMLEDGHVLFFRIEYYQKV